MAKREWEKITISITPEQKQALEKRAEEEMSSVSFLIRKAIEMFLVQPALFGLVEKPEPATEPEEV